MNAIARAVGFRFFERSARRWELRFSWAEVSGGFGFGLGLLNWEEDRDWSLHIHLGWPNIYLKLPFLPRRAPKDQMLDKWSIQLFARDIHLGWGEHTKIIHLPWDFDWIRTSVLQADGSWLTETRVSRLADNRRSVSGEEWARNREAKEAARWKETHPYTYTLNNGTVQERKATIGVEVMEWRWRALRWLPWFAKVRRYITVEFDGEVGERSGSWKGGTVGCGYELRDGETPIACLRRMEAERKF